MDDEMPVQVPQPDWDQVGMEWTGDVSQLMLDQRLDLWLAARESGRAVTRLEMSACGRRMARKAPGAQRGHLRILLEEMVSSGEFGPEILTEFAFERARERGFPPDRHLFINTLRRVMISMGWEVCGRGGRTNLSPIWRKSPYAPAPRQN